MALLTHEWRAPDPTGAVNAYLSGVNVGVREAALRAEAVQNSQKSLESAVRATQIKQKADTDMALQLLQESRLNRAAEIQAQYTAERIKNAASVTKARVSAYDRANQPPEPFTPLPEETTVPGAVESVGQPLLGAGSSGDVVNWEANAGDPGDVALSLAQKSPFARGEDFMGTTDVDRSGEIPGTMAEGSLLESANAFGGENPGAVSVGPTQTADGLPTGREADSALTLMAGADARTPADEVLSSAARRRVNLAGQKGGAKAGNDQLKVELGVAARAKAGTSGEPAAKPIVRNFPDGTARQWNGEGWDIVAEKPAADEKPILRNFADGTTRQFNRGTNEWDIKAEKPEAAERPILRNFPDGSLRQWDAETSTWEVAGEKVIAADKAAKELAAEQRAAQDQLIQRANHQRTVVGDLEKSIFKPDGSPKEVVWPWRGRAQDGEEIGKFYRIGENGKREEITKEMFDGMVSANARIQESAAELGREKARLKAFESQIDGFGSAPVPTPTPAKSDTPKLYAVEGKSVKFAEGKDFAQSVQQAVNDGLISPDQGRDVLRKAGFTPKAK